MARPCVPVALHQGLPLRSSMGWLAALVLTLASVVQCQADIATCSMRRMHCPIPDDHFDGNYVILGNESKAGNCTDTISGGQKFFDFGVDECNATVVRNEVTGSELYSVVLVPFVPVGGLSFMDHPDIHCSCEVDYRGTVMSVVVEVVDQQEAENIDGRSDFLPSMRMYPNDSFIEPLPEVGGGVSVNSERFFLKIVSNTSTDPIGVQRCTAAPTANASDPYLQIIKEDFCPQVPFDMQIHEHSVSGELHTSMRAFKFAGLDEVVLTCTIIRCAQEPCGVCTTGGGRRLQSGASVEATAVRGLSMTAGLGSNALTLPAVLSPDSFTIIYSNTERLASSAYLESSVIMINCLVSSDTSFVNSLQISLGKWLGMTDVVLTVLEVSAAGIRDSSQLWRRLQGSDAPSTTSADAVAVKFGMVPAAQNGNDMLTDIEAVFAVREEEALAPFVSAELQSSFGKEVEITRVLKGLLVRREAIGTAEPVAVSSGGDARFDDPLVIMGYLIGLCFGLCCACTCCLALLQLRPRPRWFSKWILGDGSGGIRPPSQVAWESGMEQVEGGKIVAGVALPPISHP